VAFIAKDLVQAMHQELVSAACLKLLLNSYIQPQWPTLLPIIEQQPSPNWKQQAIPKLLLHQAVQIIAVWFKCW